MAELLTASPRRTVIHTSLKNDERRNQITCRGSPVHIAVIADVQSSKTDDRQRLAKERREEREKSLAAREQQILEKERRAKLLYEKQMEERWKKLDEQRQRDEQRRAAVEEKRRQRFEVERERHEAIMRRTLERSQQLEQRQKRWSWGGAGSTGTGSRDVADRLSASAMNLPKQMDPPVSKRLSSSAAAITHSPERVHRRFHLSPMENVLISRLLTPTHSSLARSRSTAFLSCCGSHHSVSHVCPRAVSGSPFKTKSTHSRSGDRQNAGATSTSPGETKGTIFSELQQTEKVKKEKRQSSPSLTSTLRRSQSPANMSKRSSSPAAVKASSKIRTQSPSSGKEYPSSPTSSGKPSPMRQRSSSNAAAETSRKRADKEKGELAKQKSEEAAAGEIKSPDLPGNVTSAPTTPVKEHDKKKIIHAEDTKSMAGTSSAEEATKILAERRRQARLQKELEEQERREQEEAEKKMMEELQRKEAEEEARREEEARQLEEKQKQEEAERQRKAEEEKILREQQEKELLVQLEQQREEAETRAREAAERHRQERELLIQQIEQERFERKKRIEEIMKRTRRSDASEIKKEETKPEIQPTTNEEKLLSTTNTEEQGEKVEVLRTSVSLEIKHEEEPNSTVPPSEAVVQLEEIQEIQLDNIDEQPNSVDESTDELQSMDVSPMSKDDGISIPEFSPLNEVNHGVEMEKDQNGMSDAQAVKDLIDLTGCTTYAKLSSKKINLDDCNRNLIEEQCMSMEENPLITSLTKSVEETHIHTSAEL